MFLVWQECRSSFSAVGSWSLCLLCTTFLRLFPPILSSLDMFSSDLPILISKLRFWAHMDKIPFQMAFGYLCPKLVCHFHQINLSVFDFWGPGPGEIGSRTPRFWHWLLDNTALAFLAVYICTYHWRFPACFWRLPSPFLTYLDSSSLFGCFVASDLDLGVLIPYYNKYK